MLDFNSYLMRHGEAFIQSIVERLERNEGMRARTGTPLEERWEAMMQLSAPTCMAA